MSTPVLTVLMPVYNAAEYLHESISSILQQTLTNFEFLIIDDASTDNSVEIIRSYNDARIRVVLNTTNLGISKALNLGIDLASTGLIARMDADDISYPNRLQKQYEYFLSNPGCSLLSTAARVVTADGKPVRTDLFAAKYFYYNLNFICWIYHPTVMYKKNDIIEVGKYTTQYSEDFDLWWRVSRTKQMNHLEEVLVDYRQSENSYSNVLFQTEYDNAQCMQVLRNVRYYMGENLKMTMAELECLRHNFAPVTQCNNIITVVSFLHKLDRINRAILNHYNINLHPRHMREAAYHKKEFILKAIITELPFSKTLILLLLLRRGRQLFNLLSRRL